MKFCGNCGNSVPDDARACPYCGTMLSGGPAASAKKGFDAKGFFANNKKKIIAACGAIVGIVAIILILSAIFGGSYKTPIKHYFANENNLKKAELEDVVVNGMDGFAKSEIKDVYELLSSSKNFKDVRKQIEENWKEEAKDNEEEYGKDWEIDYEIDKDSLEEWDEDDIKDYQDWLKDAGKELVEKGKNITKMDNDELKEMAEDMGLKKEELKKLGEAYKELGNALRNAEVKAGYDLDVDIKIEGKDDSEEDTLSFRVMKVDGKWTSYENIVQTIVTLNAIYSAI